MKMDNGGDKQSPAQFLKSVTVQWQLNRGDDKNVATAGDETVGRGI